MNCDEMREGRPSKVKIVEHETYKKGRHSLFLNNFIYFSVQATSMPTTIDVHVTFPQPDSLAISKTPAEKLK